MTPPDVVAALTPVVEALEALGVRYHVGGSLASSAYGMPRATADVDVVAELRPEQVARLVERLQAGYYLELETVREAVHRRRSFNLIHLDTMMKVDVFVPEERPFDQQELSRARPETLDLADDARPFLLKSPEDLVLRKLEWYRAGGGSSAHQWNDVIGVLKVQTGRLDQGYLAHWPSSPCNASSLAPQPSVATPARSAATTSAGAWTRSRNTCQRMAGSEPSSQSGTATRLSIASR